MPHDYSNDIKKAYEASLRPSIKAKLEKFDITIKQEQLEKELEAKDLRDALSKSLGGKV